MELIYIILGVVAFLVGIFIVIRILKKMKGSIEIVPERYDYKSGETIQGRVVLKLKKSVKSNKLIIGLKCEKSERNHSEGNKVSTKNSVLFDFNQPIDEAKEYTPSEYPYNFSITIPQNVSQKLEGVAETLVKSAQILFGKSSSTKWYLYAELQCEGVNLSKRIQINIT